MQRRWILGSLLLGALAPLPAAADPAPFDLAGPVLRVDVTHGGVTLPIAQVPNLAEGDRLSIMADLPADQSARYLLVAAFLRGATNPPPEKWFYQAETWTRKGRKGLDLAVPAGARQVVLFLAPQTGGDFSTLRSAVRGRPGAFVRASQELNQASLDRSRLDAFLAAIQTTDPADPARTARITPQLAESLAIKLNPDCLTRMPDLQAACLMQNQDALVLNDGHSNAISDTLTGPGADLALQLSATPQGGLGYYSPYIGAIRDIIGIFGSIHTAKYQYIPALKTEHGDRIALILNAAPSFHNPKSVLVTTLPAIAPARMPPLRLTRAMPVCAGAADVLIPVSGAPLVFSTGYLHDVAFRVRTGRGGTVDAPATPDVERGGFLVHGLGAKLAGAGPAASGTLRGRWGFEPYEGPQVQLQMAGAGQWHVDGEDRRALVAGRADPLDLTGGAAACVESVALRLPSGETRPVEWKATAPDRLSLILPLADVAAGDMTLLVGQAGSKDPAALPLRAFAEASRLDAFDIRAGDSAGLLTGRRLDQIASLSADGVTFQPGELMRTGKGDALRLSAGGDAPAGGFIAGRSQTATVTFKDGRTASIRFTVGSPRPQVSIVARAVTALPETAPVAIRLTDPAELPSGATLAFSLRMANGKWTGDETIEVAGGMAGEETGAPDAPPVALSPGKGLALQDAQVAVATLDTRALPPSIFGPLRFRVRKGDVAGDWQILATLVRLPALHQLTCPDSMAADCELSGGNLYLIRSIASDALFARSIDVPDGYIGTTLKVPHPAGGTLYLKLRDDPATVNTIVGAGPNAS